MKKTFLFLFFLSLIVCSFAQDGEVQDDGYQEIVKTGWNFGGIPSVSYSTDLGFQYGVIGNAYFYGDGKVYPDYYHNIFVWVSRYTKGSGRYCISYDSKYLIPGYRVVAELAYKPEQSQAFFGFNGYQSQFNNDWQTLNSGDCKTRMFYRLQDKKYNIKTYVHVPINDDLKALVGFNIQNFKISTVDYEKMNRGKETTDDNYLDPNVPTLYDLYTDWGVFSEEEANGGFIPLLKAGLVYDTRDVEGHPMHGMYSEASVYGAPGFLGAESGFLKLGLIHRQYFTLVKNDLSFAYRLGLQTTIAGHTPFYFQPFVDGGGVNLNRGMMLYRSIGDGFAYGNVELRWKFVRFKFINQNFYLGLNGFADTYKVVKNIDIDFDKVKTKMNEDGYEFSDFFTSDNENYNDSLHTSFGLGLRIVMNENFIIAFDYARAINNQDNSGAGFSIGMNYYF